MEGRADFFKTQKFFSSRVQLDTKFSMISNDLNDNLEETEIFFRVTIMQFF